MIHSAAQPLVGAELVHGSGNLLRTLAPATVNCGSDFGRSAADWKDLIGKGPTPCP